MTIGVIGEFLSDAKAYFEALPQVAENAAMMAINQATERKALPMVRDDILEQVDFPAGYLNKEDRLKVGKKATRGDLSAVISGRDRPTSLARFAGKQTYDNSKGEGVTVTVKKGKTRVLKRAFFVKLKNGNVGVAIRLPKGQEPDRAYKPKKLDNGVFLLYGPSVDQVAQSVFDKSLPAIGDFLTGEFNRQFTRLTRG